MFLFFNYCSDMFRPQFLAIFKGLTVSLMCAAYISTYLIAVVTVVLFGDSGSVLYLVEIHCFFLSTQPITKLFKNTNLKFTFCTTNTIYIGLIYYKFNKRKKINTFTSTEVHKGTYNIKCLTCNKSYIEQTGRNLK